MQEGSLLLLPAKEFFSFELDDSANASDKEFQAMIHLNQAAVDWLNGKIDTAEYTDILSYYGIDPDEHLADNDWYLNQLDRSI